MVLTEGVVFAIFLQVPAVSSWITSKCPFFYVQSGAGTSPPKRAHQLVEFDEPSIAGSPREIHRKVTASVPIRDDDTISSGSLLGWNVTRFWDDQGNAHVEPAASSPLFHPTEDAAARFSRGAPQGLILPLDEAIQTNTVDRSDILSVVAH